MENILTRPANGARFFVTGIALLALAVVLWRVADVLVVGFGGIVLAALLRAVAEPIARRTGIKDRWVVLGVVLMFAVLVVAIAWLFGQQVTKEVSELRTQLPAALHKAMAALERTDSGRTIVESVRQAPIDSKTLSNLGVAATAVLSGLLDLLLVLFLSIYFALDVPLYRDGSLRLLPPKHRARVGRSLDDAGAALQKWLVAQAIAMGTVGTLVGVGLALVGVPLAFALGVLAALLEFVPVVGPILFSIPGVLLGFAKGPETAWYAFFVYLVVQQIEGNVLIPLLQRWAVELPPVVGLLAIVAGGLLLGVPGVIFATPLAVVIMCLVKHLYVEETLEHNPVPRAAADAAATPNRP